MTAKEFWVERGSKIFPKLKPTSTHDYPHMAEWFMFAEAYAAHGASEAGTNADWLPLAKKLSAQLKSMGAEVHPSKLEMWLEREMPVSPSPPTAEDSGKLSDPG